MTGVSGQQHAPATLYPRERPGTHFTGGWVGLRAGLDGRKISSPTGNRSRIVQPVFSRYTDWATRPTLPPGVKVMKAWCPVTRRVAWYLQQRDNFIFPFTFVARNIIHFLAVLWDRASLEQRCKQSTRCNKFRLLIFSYQLYMFRATNSPVLRSTFWLYVQSKSAPVQSKSAHEDGRVCRPKHVELIWKDQ